MSLVDSVREAAETNKLLAGVNQLDQQVADIRATEADLRSEISGAKERIARLEQSQGSPGNPTPPTGLPGAYVSVGSWQELVDAVSLGRPVKVNKEIQVRSKAVLSSSYPIKFGPYGCLALSHHLVTLNLPVINEDDHWIFRGVRLRESYPHRWDTRTRTNLNGNFGGNPLRMAKWFGLTSSTSPDYAEADIAEMNNQAIAAAAMSQDLITRQVMVRAHAGSYPIQRPVRLDGLRAHLSGEPGLMASTTLWANSNRFTFNTDHFIETELFPDGSTPMVQVGWEEQEGITNQDAGMHSGLRDITLLGPMRNREGLVSGLMWESGLQEGSHIDNICIQNYSGYGIGGPMQHHKSHNVLSDRFHYPQFNTVKLGHLWVFRGLTKESVGMSIFGICYSVDTVTVRQEGGLANGKNVGTKRSSIYCGSSAIGRWSGIHIESCVGRGESVAAMVNPVTPSVDHLQIDGLNHLPQSPWYDSTKGIALWLQNKQSSINAHNITQKGSYAHSNGYRAIRDEATGKESSGWPNTQSGGTSVTDYSRIKIDGEYYIQTSDPELK